MPTCLWTAPTGWMTPDWKAIFWFIKVAVVPSKVLIQGNPWPNWDIAQEKNTLACKRLQDAQGCPWTCSPAHQWAIRSSLQFYGAIRPRTSLSKHLQRCLGGNDCSILFKVRKSDKWTFLPIQGKTHTKPIISIQSILWNKLRRTFSLTSFSSLCTSFLPFLPLRFSVSAACCVPCFFSCFCFYSFLRSCALPNTQ